MKKLMMVAAASVAAWCSWGAESISVDEVANHYPWDGKVDCVVTLSGTGGGSYEGLFQLSVKKDDEVIRKVVTKRLGTVDGTFTNTFDCTTLFGPGYYPNGGIVVKLVKKSRVQLWANGPYFAECNVGATRPQDSGYYFWWGDTVGYTFDSTKGWCAVDGSATGFQFNKSNAKIVTCDKSESDLTSAGFIDSTGNLVAKYDAATVQWGAPWRMPTNAEIQKLVDTSYCKWTWNANWKGTGVAGYVVTGAQSGYTDKSIFLPATGYGQDSTFENFGTSGNYNTSKPIGDNFMMVVSFVSTSFSQATATRYRGYQVRPVWSAQ